ncbi:MipA/OmpV family protein [Niveispirillum fermenti]|uniref:MipA/OmpV family protein n=1 Tax=Niveispirillum fermenti TaxID=1233113 RepID=UPI003A8C530C
MMRRLLALSTALLALSGSAAAQSALFGMETTNDTAPLWEASLLAAGGYIAHYPAASEGQFKALPIPFLIYRGDHLRIGDDGFIRARQEMAGGRLELDIGLDGSFDVDSKDNKARSGMPDLDLLIEAGPKLTWHFLPGDASRQIDLGVELRAVIATRFIGFDYEGITLNPELSWFERSLGGTKMRGYASIGPIFGFDGVNDYFYQVDPVYATPDRPAYRAQNGYIGTKTTLGLAYPVTERLLVFGAAQVGYYGGSANEDSPLFREKTNVSVGAGLRWSFWQSEARVPVIR